MKKLIDMRKFETKEELVEWIETMHLQNTNGRETEEEMFRLGIEAAIEELTEFNLFSIPFVVGQSEQLVCDVCGSNDVIEAPHMGRNCNRCNPL